MKKKICSFITRFGGTMAALALVVATMTANSTCAWLAYQPEEPEEVKMHCIFRYADKLIHFYIDSKRNNFSR